MMYVADKERKKDRERNFFKTQYMRDAADDVWSGCALNSKTSSGLLI